MIPRAATSPPRALATALLGLALLAALLTSWMPRAAHGQGPLASSFASAVPCVSAGAPLAVSSFADTIVRPVNNGRSTLLEPAVGIVAGDPRPVYASLGQVGAVYGLAYDDGSVSGVEGGRLLMGAYVRRLTGFAGGEGPGTIYEYRLKTKELRVFARVGAGPADIHGGIEDRNAVAHVGRSGLGDMEVSPDGTTLYAANLFTRQIERLDLRNGTSLGALAVPFALVPGAAGDASIAADLTPFALAFYPDPLPGTGPALVVGVTDTARRNVVDVPEGAQPTVHVLTYMSGNGQWFHSLSQDLITPFWGRLAGGNFYDGQMKPWYPWNHDVDTIPFRMGKRLLYPMPLLSDIRFSRDGKRMFLAIRDIQGDMTAANGGGSLIESVAQGDTLAYNFVGGTTPHWELIGGEYATDDFDQANPSGPSDHIENHMGAIATELHQVNIGRTPYSGYSEDLHITALLGGNSSGVERFAESGGSITELTPLIGPTDAAGGKASSLGDIEWLCSFALRGGMVWRDRNGNNVRDADEPGIADVEIDLWRDNQYITTARTNNAGQYLFAVPTNAPFTIGLSSMNWLKTGSPLRRDGAFLSLVAANAGGDDEYDSDADPWMNLLPFGAPVPKVDPATLVPAALRDSDQRNFDFGVRPTPANSTIAGVVWSDNGDSRYTTSEQGVRDVEVILERRDDLMRFPSLQSFPRRTHTDANGRYSFTNVEPGFYRVRFDVTGIPGARGVPIAFDNSANETSGWAARPEPLVVKEATTVTVSAGLLLGADLVITKSAPARVSAGMPIVYILSYANAGPTLAREVSIVDTLPGGVRYLSATPPPSSQNGDRLTWTLGDLPNGMQGSISVTVESNAATPLIVSNSATINTTSTDPNPTNNLATAVSRVVRPDLFAQKEGPADALAGDIVLYTLRYGNQGDGPATATTVIDTLPPGMYFVEANPPPTTLSGQTMLWDTGDLGPGATGIITLQARATVAVAAGVAAGQPVLVTNRQQVVTTAIGDPDPANNNALVTSRIRFPDLALTLNATPAPVPVGTPLTYTLTYHNQGDGLARATLITVTLPAGVGYVSATTSCSYNATTRALVCTTGDLAAGMSGPTLRVVVDVPAGLPADQLEAGAIIAAQNPERPDTLADNTAGIATAVIRPNPYVRASGPTAIVGEGSFFWYTIDYGNLYRRNPALTRDAEQVELVARLDPAVRFVAVSDSRCSHSGGVVTCNLGRLAARAVSQVIITVQTEVPAGTRLRLDAEISTITPGDDLSDNQASVLTNVVPPPDHLPAAASDVRLAMHSDLDPLSRDTSPDNAVYLSEGAAVAWPAGEVLDFTPRLVGLDLDEGRSPLPWPYEYRARVIGWSVGSFAAGGRSYDPRGTDDAGRSGCRAGTTPVTVPQRLSGCTRGYIGGANLAEIRSGRPAPNEAQMAGQIHAYWSQPPAPPFTRSDVFIYLPSPLRSARLSVQIEVEVWVVNAFPGDPIGDGQLPEEYVRPLPSPERQLIERSFTITLLAPRSLVGPGSETR